MTRYKWSFTLHNSLPSLWLWPSEPPMGCWVSWSADTQGEGSLAESHVPTDWHSEPRPPQSKKACCTSAVDPASSDGKEEMRIQYTKEGKIRDGDYIYQERGRDKGMGLHLPRRKNKGLGYLPWRKRQGNEIESTKRERMINLLYILWHIYYLSLCPSISIF